MTSIEAYNNSYCLEGEDLSETDKNEIKSFINNKWKAIEEEDIDPDLTEYIMVCLSYRRNMHFLMYR